MGGQVGGWEYKTTDPVRHGEEREEELEDAQRLAVLPQVLMQPPASVVRYRASPRGLGQGPLPRLRPATSAPGPGSPLPRLRRDWAHPGHICAGTGLGVRWARLKNLLRRRSRTIFTAPAILRDFGSRNAKQNSHGMTDATSM